MGDYYPPPNFTPPRWWERIQKTPTCWLWIGGKFSTGYGKLMVNRRRIGAHRVSYMMFVGEIPEGLWVLHRCGVRACVRPTHLYTGTVKENVADMVAAGKHRGQQTTVCPQGHGYDEANTHTDKKGMRHCRSCDRERHRERKHGRLLPAS